MIRALIALASLVPMTCAAQSVAGSYAGRDGRIATVVIACPSQDGSFTAGPCALSKRGRSSTPRPRPAPLPRPTPPSPCLPPDRSSPAVTW